MSWNNYSNWSRILGIILFISAIALCIRSTYEPDIWWQIRTGEYIIENNAVPTHDVFSYTYSEVRWINVKWLTEVIMATVNNSFGAESLFILQIIVLLFILLSFYKVFNLGLNHSKSKSVHPPYFYLAILLFLLTITFRINARPEMISHLFTAITLYLYWCYRNNNKSRIVYLAIPLQILWANMHEAYGVGIVVWLIVLGGYLLENIYSKTLSKNWKKHYSLVLILIVSFFATAISPHGTAMWLQPINIFEQLGKNQFTSELISFTDAEYWNFYSLLNLFLFLIGLIWLTKQLIQIPTMDTGKRSKRKKRGNLQLNGKLSYTLLYLAFFYLSLKSYRNIPFFMIVGFSAYAHGLSLLAIKRLQKQNKRSLQTIGLLAILFYIAIVSDFLYSKTNVKNRYGWQIDTTRTPIGASTFIKENQIKGKAFTDFMVSSYLLYDLQPDFKSFIDLRDLDIFPAEFFKNNIIIYQQPTATIAGGSGIWDFVVNEDQYNYIVLTNKPNIMNLQRHLVHNDDRYALVFADDVSSVYLRNNVSNFDLIKKFALNNGKEVYHELPIIQPRKISTFINKIFNPFFTLVNTSGNNRINYYKYINYDTEN